MRVPGTAVHGKHVDNSTFDGHKSDRPIPPPTPSDG